MKTAMYAAMYYEPGRVQYQETATPQAGPGELLVRVHTALTCGTDVKCYRRGHPVLLKNLPSGFGHEFAGVVATLGEGVTGFKIGDRVVAANSAPCDACFYCEKGQHNLCEHLNLLNGAYADYLKIPARIVARNTYHLPEHLPFEIAAFTEPLAVSLRGVEMAGVKAGDHVAVFGLGPIGQLLTRAAKLQGAHVSAIGRSERKRTLAQQFGQADQVISIQDIDLSDPAMAQRLKDEYTPQGRGFDVVIEAVGLPQTWEQSVSLVRRGGVVNWFAGCESGSTIRLDTRKLHYDEITLLSLFHHTPEFFQKALQLLGSGVVDPTALITEVLPMARFEEALQRVEAGQAMKIALKNDWD